MWYGKWYKKHWGCRFVQAGSCRVLRKDLIVSKDLKKVREYAIQVWGCGAGMFYVREGQSKSLEVGV